MYASGMPEAHDVNIWTLLDLCTPWCLHVVATLHIPERIEAGMTDVEALATASGAHAGSLHRVLQHLVAQGVFEEPAPGRFALNAPARALLDASRGGFLDLDSFGGRMAGVWAGLLSSVRTGAPAYQQIFGRPFWDDLQAHPEISASFDALMGPPGHGTPDPGVLIADDWTAVRTVVDVGGGTGALLAEILRARPGVRGVLVDQPATIARSSALLEAAGVADRVTGLAQSFFEPLPAGADLYLLKSVLSDWPDREVIAILTRCADAARPEGRVVIVNGVWPDDAGTLTPDVLMLVLVGGRQRRLSELRALADAAGLEIRAAAPHASHRFLVECRPR
jgi:SAM-dependent methyltransferase